MYKRQTICRSDRRYGEENNGIIENIENISLKFAKGDQWVDEWPLTDWISNNGLPKVAEISFELEGFGQITRLYMLPSGEVL